MSKEGKGEDEKIEFDPKQFEKREIKIIPERIVTKIKKPSLLEIEMLGILLKKFEVKRDPNTNKLTTPSAEGKKIKLKELENDLGIKKGKTARILKILNDENLILKEKINTSKGPVLNITLNLDNIGDKIKKRSR